MIFRKGGRLSTDDDDDVGPVSSVGRVQVFDREVQGSGLGRVGGGFHMYSWSRRCSAYVALKLKGEYHAYIQIKMYAPEKVNAKKKKSTDDKLFYNNQQIEIVNTFNSFMQPGC